MLEDSLIKNQTKLDSIIKASLSTRNIAFHESGNHAPVKCEDTQRLELYLGAK